MFENVPVSAEKVTLCLLFELHVQPLHKTKLLSSNLYLGVCFLHPNTHGKVVCEAPGQSYVSVPKIGEKQDCSYYLWEELKSVITTFIFPHISIVKVALMLMHQVCDCNDPSRPLFLTPGMWVSYSLS